MSTTPMTAAAIPTILCQVIGSSRNNTPSARPDADGWRTCKPICLISLAFIKGLAVGVSLAKDTLGISCRDGACLDHPVVKFFGVFSCHPVILKAAFEEPYHDGVHHLARVEGSLLSRAQPRGWVRPYKYLHRQSEAVGSRPYARLEEELAFPHGRPRVDLCPGERPSRSHRLHEQAAR